MRSYLPLSTGFLWGRGLSPPTPHNSVTLHHADDNLTFPPERSQCLVTHGSETEPISKQRENFAPSGPQLRPVILQLMRCFSSTTLACSRAFNQWRSFYPLTGKLIDSPWTFPGVYDLEMTVMVILLSSDQNRVACPLGKTQLGRGWSASQRQSGASLLTLHLVACPCKTLSLYLDISTFLILSEQDALDSQCNTAKPESNFVHIWMYSILAPIWSISHKMLLGHFP